MHGITFRCSGHSTVNGVKSILLLAHSLPYAIINNALTKLASGYFVNYLKLSSVRHHTEFACNIISRGHIHEWPFT